MDTLAGRSLISIQDFSNEEILSLLDLAEKMAEALGWENTDDRQGPEPLDAILATLFFEPSTRTRMSFESAMLRLGGGVISMAEAKATSAAKGESLADTAQIISGYCDIIVVRHSEAGSAQIVADNATVPVINAGDGTREHPTQALTDLFCLQRHKGTLSGLKVGLCGDLKYGRTVHSLAPALARMGCELVFISPPALAMPPEIVNDVQQHSSASPVQSEELQGALADLDMLYMTRIQRERFEDPAEYERYKGVYVLDKATMKQAPDDMLIMHPLPRVDEISPEIDDDPRAVYFEQAAGGVPVRMALIALLLGIIQESETRRSGLTEPT